MNRQADALMTVGKTAEQLEAERKAEEHNKKMAEWARLKAQADKADPSRCQGRVYSGTMSLYSSQCHNKAKYHREEPISAYEKASPTVTRHYCPQHDEVTKRAKQEARWAEQRKEREEKYARENRVRNRQALVDAAVGHLSNEKLKELAAFLQTQDGFRKEPKK